MKNVKKMLKYNYQTMERGTFMFKRILKCLKVILITIPLIIIVINLIIIMTTKSKIISVEETKKLTNIDCI